MKLYKAKVSFPKWYDKYHIIDYDTIELNVLPVQVVALCGKQLKYFLLATSYEIKPKHECKQCFEAAQRLQIMMELAE